MANNIQNEQLEALALSIGNNVGAVWKSINDAPSLDEAKVDLINTLGRAITALQALRDQPIIEYYLGEIKAVAIGYTPRGWMDCCGQLLQTADHPELYSLLGTTFGGNGIDTFALPNLNGRVMLGQDTNYPLGKTGGAAQVILGEANLPSHTHGVSTRLEVAPYGASAASGGVANPADGNHLSGISLSGSPGAWSGRAYLTTAPTSTVNLGGISSTASSTGSGSPVPTLPPYLVLRFIICVDGLVMPQS
jgi:microcystin-dependent protein